MIVSEQFVYTGGAYQEFRGYVFAKGKPVTVKDGATAEALKQRKDFSHIKQNEVQDEKETQAAPKILDRVTRTLRLPGKGKA